MECVVSFIIPAYNAEQKLHRCVKSLDELYSTGFSFEAIFVDDFSNDNTLRELERICSESEWAKLVRLPQNSGSPSRPRNVGVQRALGDYVYFLDIDDSLLPTSFLRLYELVSTTSSDVGRAPLIRRDGNFDRVLNEIPNWGSSASHSERVRLILENQSTTVCGLIRRQLLVSNEIFWDESIRVGEDTLFWIEVLKSARKIEYSPDPDFVYHVTQVEGTQSSTQSYEDRELADHLTVWKAAESQLQPLGVSFFECRGQIALQTCLQSLIRHNRNGLSEKMFRELSSFVILHRGIIEQYNFNRRLTELCKLLFVRDYAGFNEQIKQRLLIAGYDLKFIKPSIEPLRRFYQIELDEWTGHDTHDSNRSEALLKWAEVIHCEWLLGNAVWYSQRKRADQRLVVRTHLFEIGRSFGDHIAVDSIDRFIAVSLPTLEDAQLRFRFPRDRVRLIPNFIDVQKYERSEDPAKLFDLAIVGILPARKGFHRALQLLAMLRQVDSRYNLTVYGKRPSELPWVAADPTECDYFSECDRLVDFYNLEGAVKYAGWVDTKVAMATHAFVLSVSDFESFHVAPAEAFAAGNCALFLAWRGVEYIYPSQYIFTSITEMRDKVLELREMSAFIDYSKTGIEFVADNYSLTSFVRDYTSMIQSI